MAQKKTSAIKREASQTTEKAPSSGPRRFLGWQKTPATQATFGRTTRGGSNNIRFQVLHSTGSVESVQGNWYLVDASKMPVGRLATTIATLLMGKGRTTFSPGAGGGDAVIVINSDKAHFTSNKSEKKTYYHHTLYMGGLKSATAHQLLKSHPERVITMAVQGMMPKNKLSRYQLALLKIYKGAEHGHAAQKPIEVNFDRPLKKQVVSA